jgi:hypothetical protein
MKKFFKKQRELVIIIAYAGLVFVLVYFVILPLISRINTKIDQIQEENIQQEIVRQQIEDLPKIQQQYDVLQKEEGLIDVLLDRNDAVTLIKKLEKLAENSGNKITIAVQDAPVQPVQKSNPKTAAKTNVADSDDITKSLPSTNYMQLKITLDGNYNSIVNFVKLLEKFEYYSDIIGIQIRQNESSGGQTANIGTLNSSNTVSKNGEEIKPTEENKTTLEASLDVVFYTKN